MVAVLEGCTTCQTGIYALPLTPGLSDVLPPVPQQSERRPATLPDFLFWAVEGACLLVLAAFVVAVVVLFLRS